MMAQSPPPMWFDPQFRAKTPDLRKAVKRLGAHLIDHERKTGRRERARAIASKKNFYLAVEALACNLLLLKATASDAKLAVPRAHDFLWSGERKPSPVYGQHFLDAIDLLSSLNLINDETRGFRISKTNKAASLISPGDGLGQHLPLAPPDWKGIDRLDDPNLIVLKEGKDDDGRAAAINFTETALTKSLAGQVKRINKFLREANVEVVGSPDRLSLGRDGQVIVPCRRSLRRIFNNNSWQNGGRLAGGFWMSMERAQRFEQIRIDGQPIADVDYRQLFPRLAYVRAGASQPVGDIYDIAGDGTGRSGWKTLMNAMLFAYGPLKNWPNETIEHFPEGTKLRDAIEMLKRKHAPISHLFGTKLGFQFMHIESEMLIRVLSYLQKKGIIALPLHDAVLVRSSHAEAAKNAMQVEFEHLTGARGAIVSIDFSLVK